MATTGSGRPRLLVFITVLAGTTILWWIWSAVGSYQAQAETHSRSLRIVELRGLILQLDEVLTMSARMRASTGDPAWERRYDEYDPQLSAAIDEICALAKGAGLPPMAVATREANDRLVALERESFRLGAQGGGAEALRLLVSPEYERQKDVYSRGMSQLSVGLQQALDERLSTEHRRTIVSIALAGSLLAVFVWTFIVQSRRTTQRSDVLLGEMAQKLRVSEERFRRLVDSDVIGITVGDSRGNVLEANDAFLKMVGYTRDDLVQGRVRWMEMTPPEWGHVNAKIGVHLEQTGRVPALEKEYFRKDGTRVPILIGMVRIPGAKEETVCFVLDITERKRVESQLGQAQKMEVVGKLAGGIAHDFNNLLCAINGFSSLALDKLSPDHPAAECLVEVGKAGERASELTRQLLAFSRQQHLQPKVIELNGLVADMQRMLRRLIGEHIRLKVIPDRETAHVLADPGQLQQVILNLVVNARDAMPSGGDLTLQTSRAPGEPALAQITVTDTGTGMDEATRLRLFEPFFTTKGVGRGTGLGLSTVYGIVKQSGGEVSVRSGPGQGSTFIITLPRIAGGAATARHDVAFAGRGTETILLVEDEDQVRRLASEVLQKKGYRIVEAVDGRAALDLLTQRGDEIDLLLSDVVMPNMGGKELIGRARGMRPGLRMVLMSGYTETQLSEEELMGALFLQKPFTADSLTAAVRERLDRKAGELPVVTPVSTD